MFGRFAAASLVLAMVTPAAALGAEGGTHRRTQSAMKITRLSDGTVRYEYRGELVVYGDRHRPMATYVLSRTRQTYRRPRLQKNLINKVVRAVSRPPF